MSVYIRKSPGVGEHKNDRRAAGGSGPPFFYKRRGKGKEDVDAKEVTGETRKNRKYKALLQQMIMESDEDRKTVLAQKLYEETISSWDNILRLEGRRLRSFPTPYGVEVEKYDIQAAFPVIMKDWIVAVDDV